MFVGRSLEQAHIAEKLARGARLITILGPGGIGKTRLALEAARGTGARFCDLSSASSPFDLLLVVAAMLETDLGSIEDEQAATAMLSGVLERRGELVILDNFEQLLPEGARVIESWLSSTSSPRFLITSRAPLRTSVEERLELPPLTEEEGATLFRSRCGALGLPPAAVGPEQDAIAEIVRRLDGIPLAIELAAARAPLLGPRRILARLDQLGPASRDRPERQATLEKTIAWSWGMLDDAERQALAETAVFVGTFSVEACEAVLGPTLAGRPTLELLHGLREKSLLRIVGGASPGVRRLRHFEIVRIFASARLDELGTAELVARRHAVHYLAVVERLAEELNGPEGALAQADFAAELDNVWAAERRVFDSEPAIAARILLAAQAVLILRGPFAGGLEMATRALDAAVRSGDPLLMVAAHVARAEVLVFQRRHAEADGDLKAALAGATAAGADRLRGQAIRWIGIVAREDGRVEEAERALEEALSISRTIGDRLLEARALSNLGTLRRFQLRDEEAVELYDRALAGHQALRNAQGEIVVLGNIGHLHAASGRLRAAVAAYREALEHQPDRVDRRSEAIIMAHLGGVEARLGQLDPAGEHEERALRTFEELGDGPMEALVSAQLGTIAAARHDLEAASRWFTRSRRISMAFSSSGWRVACEVLEGLLDVARADTAMRQGDKEEAAAHLDRARKALASARDGMEIGTVHSEHVRQAVERLQAALEHGVPEASPSKPALTIAADGSWFSVESEAPVDLSRRGPLARLLRRLLERRLAAPDEVVTLDELLEAGWTGERVLPEAGRARVYSAIRALRRFGLEQVLITRDGGYLLHPAALVTRA